jgi:cellulose synthase (UDP-forming)
MNRGVQLVYTARDKCPGVPHHAKAGNINSALLKAGDCSGDFALVLDCDMIVHPDFLQRTLGHFYEQREGGGWALKPKAAFLQTPQDFWNVAVTDPMGHAARFFYGPMLQVGGVGGGGAGGAAAGAPGAVCCWCTCCRHSPCWPQVVRQS